MARLPRGWARLKTIGDVSPVLILVNRESGKFGTSIDDGETIREWDTMAHADQFVKAINEADAVHVVVVEDLGDEVLQVYPVRIRKTGRFWTKVDGTAIHSYHLTKYFIPDQLVLAEIEQLRQQHDELRKTMRELRDRAWDLVRTMQPVDPESK